MPADRLLSTLLRSLQTYTDQQDTPRLLATATSVLTTLSNPHNLTLLTSHLLTAPALWDRATTLRNPLHLLSVFHSAITTLLTHHTTLCNPPSRPPPPTHLLPIGGGLTLDAWVRAVVAGADDRSARWKHLLVLGGLLVGIGAAEEQGMEIEWVRGLRRRIEGALVKAVNLALVEVRQEGGDGLGGWSVALVLNHAFGCLGEGERRRLHWDLLLPVLIGTAFFSSEGFHSAYFIGGVDLDVVEVPGKKFNWPASSSSFKQVEAIMSRPLVSSMGPLSRLMAHAVENVQDPWLIQTMLDDLASFARALTTQWRQNKLSEIDASEESLYLNEEALQTTLPLLWKLLKATLFATTVVLRGVMSRVLRDGTLAADGVAPVLATQILHTLRNLYFISSRLGPSSFTQHTFVYLTAIDILTTYPLHSDTFLKSISPPHIGSIPHHPLDRTLDLFFLNTAEHFTLTLPASTNEDILVCAAVPYLAAAGNHNMLPIFEAAHSVMLAVLSAPQSADTAAKNLPFYVDALFKCFPHNLSPRQFRLAFKTLLRVTAPPSPLSSSHPDLPATLLELLYHRTTAVASTSPLPPDAVQLALAGSDAPPPPLSEQAVLVLTLLDVLPFLPIPLLEEWMPLLAGLVWEVQDVGMREVLKERFWEVLVSGEMDPQRSVVGVVWWGSRGGREMVILGRHKVREEDKFMSGGL
ncbi:hypothetical protein K432DRAFT_335540, partial [Lepidopterella palustris CBS 459.81]